MIQLDKNKKAIAIKYDPSENDAPSILAKGRGIVADNIIKGGNEASVPIYENRQLAEELIHIQIGNQIPPKLYEVVAQILVFVNDLDVLEGLSEKSKLH